MKKIIIAGVASLAVCGVYADPIQLASLSNLDGKVLVNQGRGFVAAKPGMTLKDGDRVIALDGSHAAVVYADGCVTQLQENSVIAMSKAAGCNNEPMRTGGGTEQPVRVAQAIGGGPGRSGAPGTQSGVASGMTLGAPGGVVGFGSTAALIVGGAGLGFMMGDTYSKHGMQSTHAVSPQ
jgi:hypothetical protein